MGREENEKRWEEMKNERRRLNTMYHFSNLRWQESKLSHVLCDAGRHTNKLQVHNRDSRAGGHTLW